MQKTFIIIGLLILLIGIGWPWLSKLPFGRLPGDFIVDRENFRFYFPLMSTVLLSAIVSLVLWWLRK